MKFSDVVVGEILQLSSGEYSDYQINTIVRANKDFNLKEIQKAYGKKPTYSGFKEFINYLVQSKIVDEISYKEWNIGGYSLFDSDSFTASNSRPGTTAGDE